MPESAHSVQSLTAQDEGPPCLATIECVAAGDRMDVMCRGELDLGTRRLESELHDILARSATGVDLDLSAVGFCDCGGLNVLLGLRRQALTQGKSVTVRACSPSVERLLDLTGARELFVPPHADGPDAAPAVVLDGPGGYLDVNQELRTEVAQLRRAMRSRPAIDLARGILMASFSLSSEDAWSVLVTASQNTNTKVHHLAQDLMDTVHGTPLREEVRQHMAAAVEQVRNAEPGTPPCA